MEQARELGKYITGDGYYEAEYLLWKKNQKI